MSYIVHDDHRAFWHSQKLHPANSAELLKVVTLVLLGGPLSDLLGVRAVADLASKDDIPDTRFFLIQQIVFGWTRHREVTYSAHRLGKEAWKKWDTAVEENLKSAWPHEIPTLEYPWWEITAPESSNEIPTEVATTADESLFQHQRSIRQHPGHFTGDWTFFRWTPVTLIELSFTRLGFPSILSRKRDGEGTWERPRHGESGVFGRSWNIQANGRVMPWHIFAFIVSQITLGHDLETSEVANCTTVFVKRYICSWPKSNWTNWCCLGDRMLHAQFHIRHLTIQEDSAIRSTKNPASSGLVFERDSEHAISPGFLQGFLICETRSAVAITTSLWHHYPCYTLMNLTDDKQFNLDGIGQQKIWADLGLQPCHEFGGVAIFQAAIGILLTEWSRRWVAALDQITAALGDELKEILGSVEDDNKSPQVYRAVGRLLLKSRRMISELSHDFYNLIIDLRASISAIPPHTVLDENWEALRSYHGKLERILLNRIEDKLEDLKIEYQAQVYDMVRDTRAGNSRIIPCGSAMAVSIAILLLCTLIRAVHS
ncbi:hypothetical protein FALCPG4_015507 [Fusarium falciforme]